MTVPFVFVLILMTHKPDGQIVGHIEGQTSDMIHCHEMVAKAMTPDKKAMMAKMDVVAHPFCINMTPLHTADGPDFTPQGSVTISWNEGAPGFDTGDTAIPEFAPPDPCTDSEKQRL